MVTDHEDGVRVTRTLLIPLEEFEFRATTSGGPGGQHANRSLTRIEARFDVRASEALGPRQRARLLERLGPVVRATAAEERSQSRNRRRALDRLAAKLAGALHVDPPRHATRPSRAARTRRLDDKRQQSQRKQGRRRPGDDD